MDFSCGTCTLLWNLSKTIFSQKWCIRVQRKDSSKALKHAKCYLQSEVMSLLEAPLCFVTLGCVFSFEKFLILSSSIKNECPHFPPCPSCISSQIQTLETWEYPHLCPVGILPLSLFLLLLTYSPLSASFVFTRPENLWVGHYLMLVLGVMSSFKIDSSLKTIHNSKLIQND